MTPKSTLNPKRAHTEHSRGFLFSILYDVRARAAPKPHGAPLGLPTHGRLWGTWAGGTSASVLGTETHAVDPHAARWRMVGSTEADQIPSVGERRGRTPAELQCWGQRSPHRRPTSGSGRGPRRSIEPSSREEVSKVTGREGRWRGRCSLPACRTCPGEPDTTGSSRDSSRFLAWRLHPSTSSTGGVHAVLGGAVAHPEVLCQAYRTAPRARTVPPGGDALPSTVRGGTAVPISGPSPSRVV